MLSLSPENEGNVADLFYDELLENIIVTQKIKAGELSKDKKTRLSHLLGQLKILISFNNILKISGDLSAIENTINEDVKKKTNLMI